MKRLSFIICSMLMVVGSSMITSCGDNTDFWGAHILTDDEIAEMKRQDSIKEAQRNTINADLVLEYTVEDYPTPDGIWTSKKLEIDFDAIGECFGLSAQQVIDGINQEDGAPEITGFAIQNSTHADYATASTSNGLWGHWFDDKGDAGTWGDLTGTGTIAFFVEWQGYPGEKDNYFSVGQFPGKFEAGQSFTCIEALKYQDKRVAVKITFNIIERGAVTGGVVASQEYDVEMLPFSDWNAEFVEFDVNAVKTALGVSSMSEVEFIGVKSDGTYQQTPTANSGFWYNIDGGADDYANGAFYIEYYGNDEADVAEFPEDEYTFYIGQMPNLLEGGYTAAPQFGFTANNKIVMITFNIKIKAYEDPETPPTGDPLTDATLDVTIEKNWTDTYDNVRIDVKDALREAFKMTTYQIHKAKVNGDLKIYCGEITEEEPGYTSDYPGYWLNNAGGVTNWGDGSAVFCCLGSSETELYLYAGNFPDQESCPENTEVKTVYYICCNGGILKANITIKIGGVAAAAAKRAKKH